MSQSRVKLGRTVLRLKKTGWSTWNLFGKGPKFTVFLFWNLIFVSQPRRLTFSKTLSHLPKIPSYAPAMQQKIFSSLKETNFSSSAETNFWIFAKFCKHLVKIETQQIVNLLNSSGNEHSKFAVKKGTLLTLKQGVAVKRKSNQIFNELNRIKSLCLFWCFSYRKY